MLVLLSRVLSTAAVYGGVTPADYTSGVTTADTVAAAHRGVLSPQTRWHNALARPAQALAPEITAAQNAMIQAGAQHAHVSGSGPTVFAVCQEEGAARTLADRLQEQRHTAEIVPFVQSGWAWGEAGA